MPCPFFLKLLAGFWQICKILAEFMEKTTKGKMSDGERPKRNSHQPREDRQDAQVEENHEEERVERTEAFESDVEDAEIV